MLEWDHLRLSFVLMTDFTHHLKMCLVISRNMPPTKKQGVGGSEIGKSKAVNIKCSQSAGES